MKCREARTIINLLMDGEQHPKANGARAHVDQCASCTEWQSSMDQALSFIPPGELPEIDLAPAIMSRLPEHHPASQLHRRRIPSRALAWIGACWVAGLLAVLMIGLQVYHLFTPGWAQVAAIRLFDFTRVFMSMLAYAISTGKVLLTAVLHVFEYQGITARGIGSYALWSVVFDLILIAAILAIWLRKKKNPGLFMVIS